MKETILRPDSKGRLNLGELAKNVSSYRVRKEENGNLVLIPFAEIPFSEKWIFENPEILEKIKSKLTQESSE